MMINIPLEPSKRSNTTGKIISPRSTLTTPKSKPPTQITKDLSFEDSGFGGETKSSKKIKQNSLKRFLSPRSYSLSGRKKSSMEDSTEETFSERSRIEEGGGGFSDKRRKDSWRGDDKKKLLQRVTYGEDDFVDVFEDRGDDKESERGNEKTSDREKEEVEESEEFQITIDMTPENVFSIEMVQRFIRKANAEAELERRIQFQIQRTHIFYEIVDTEETYVQGLTTLIEEVYDPVLASQKSPEPILDPSLFKSLFPEGHIKIIYTAHKGFIEDFRQKKKDWNHYQTVGDVFLTMCGFLRLYTRYAETYSEVEGILETLKKEKKFMTHFKEKWSNTDPITHLSSLLITPIQRIPRYQLLLNLLFKKTWEDHRDYEALGTALEEMIKTAKHVNDKAKEADNARKLVMIDTSLFGMKSKVSETIVAANRKFVKEGFLSQRNEKGEWKKRYFFLLSDLLIRARANRKQKGSFIFLEKVNLKKLEISRTIGPDVKDLVAKDLRNRCFELNHPHPMRYILAAPSVDDRNEWYIEFERVLFDLHEAEAKHEEAVKKVSSQKAYIAKNLISQSLMQHATALAENGNNSVQVHERIQGAKAGSAGTVGQKSKTADPTTIRAYAEHMAVARMSPQERWENVKQAEQDVQNWEKTKKEQEQQKQMEEEEQKKSKEEETENKKKEIQLQLHTLTYGQVRNYREAMAQYKQGKQF